MSDVTRPRATYHNGALVPDDWIPVTNNVVIGDQVVCLYIGTGGGDLTAGFVQDDGTNQRVFKNVVNGQIIPGRFYNVTATSGAVANILAGIVL